jgi:hypothetical protein
MKIEEYRANLQKVIQGLEKEAERVSIAMAQSSLSIVKERSIREGIFVDGIDGNTQEYSTNPIPTFFFAGKERNARGKKYIKDNKLGTWQGFRVAQGLPSDKVNLSYTNRHWASMAIQQTGILSGIAFAKIGTIDPEVIKYAKYLRSRYGNYLRPTDSEKKDILNDGAKELTSYIKRTLKNG